MNYWSYAEQRHAQARKALGMTQKEWRGIRDAAKDAHMDVFAYARLMLLAAAGYGGVTEHLERAIEASGDVDKTTLDIGQYLAARTLAEDGKR